MKKATALLLLLFFTLSLSLPAYGASTTSMGKGMGQSSGQGPGMGGQQGMRPGNGQSMGGNGFASQLASLVTAGTITQAQANAVEAALKPAQGETPGTSTIETKLDALVEAGTITEAQEEAILEAMQAHTDGSQTGQQSQGNPVETALTALVTAGTITQDVADTIIDAITPSDDNTSTTKTNMEEALASELAALVSVGTITQDQSDAITKVLQRPADNGNGNGNGNGHHMKLQIGSNKMTVGSNEQQIDPGYATAPVIKNGTTYVPIRAIVETWGGKVSYDSGSKTLTISLNGNTVEMVIGSTTATVNGETVTLSTPAYISSTGRTMVPIRFLAESLDLTVNWDSSTKTIDIE